MTEGEGNSKCCYGMSKAWLPKPGLWSAQLWLCES
jgi:hypothetical protein